MVLSLAFGRCRLENRLVLLPFYIRMASSGSNLVLIYYLPSKRLVVPEPDNTLYQNRTLLMLNKVLTPAK